MISNYKTLVPELVRLRAAAGGATYHARFGSGTARVLTSPRTCCGWAPMNGARKRVTLIPPNLSGFALHARAIHGPPILVIHQYGSSASFAALIDNDGGASRHLNLAAALAEPDMQRRLFGKPTGSGRRRMALTLARADTLEATIVEAVRVKEQLRIELRARHVVVH